jgi:hypothetical protein
MLDPVSANPEAPAPRPTYLDKTFGGLQKALAALALEVPEIEGMAVVVLWRGLADQSSVPSTLIQGADAQLKSPDQLFRLHRAVLKLNEFCVAQEALAVNALLKLADDLARAARSDRDAPRTEPITPLPPAADVL